MGVALEIQTFHAEGLGMVLVAIRAYSFDYFIEYTEKWIFTSNF